MLAHQPTLPSKMSFFPNSNQTRYFIVNENIYDSYHNEAYFLFKIDM